MDDISTPPVHPLECEAWRTDFPVSPELHDELTEIRQQCRKAHEILSRKLRTLQTRLERLDAAVAPHRKLPPEILGRIFELARGRTIHVPNVSIPLWQTQILPGGSVDTKFLPNEICVLWRNVALVTPALWQKVSVNLLNYTDIADENLEYEEMMDRLASMGRNALLHGSRSLQIKYNTRATTHPSRDGGRIDLLKALVMPVAYRLERLEIDYPLVPQPFIDEVIRLLPMFPEIKEILVDFVLGGEEFFPLLDKPLQSLRTLVAVDLGPNFKFSPVPALFSEDGLLNWLSFCPQLRECHIPIGCQSYFPLCPFLPNVMVHNSLEVLNLYRAACKHGPTRCNPMSALLRLQLPSLYKLKLTSDDHWENDTLSLRLFLERSGCRLRELQTASPIKANGIEPDWRSIFPYLSSVETFYILDLIGPETLDGIATGRVLPSLRRLRCEVESLDANCEAVKKVIHARHQGPEEELRYAVNFSPLSRW